MSTASRSRPLGVSILVVLSLSCLAGRLAAAQAPDYPAKPIRLIVPFSAGGGVDLCARLVGQRLSDAWAQPVVIENRPGAAGTVAGDYVAQAAPDGYTVLITVPTQMVVQHLFTKAKYDPIRDFAPVTLLTSSPFVWIVSPAQPFQMLADLAVYAKTRPVQYGTSGVGSPQHIYGELFSRENGLQLQHIAYRGVAPAMNDVVAGHIPTAIGEFGSSKPLIEGGKVRALAIMAAKRNPALPDIPTFAEAGYPGFDQGTWFGAFVPAGTPKPIVDKLAAEMSRIVRSAEIAPRLAEYGWEPGGGTAEEFDHFAKATAERHGRVIDQANIRIE